MRGALLLALAGGAAIAVAAARRKPAGQDAPAPVLTGLGAGAWYRVTVRSTFGRLAFDIDAAGQQIQSLLGRQGFAVRDVRANAEGDPYVYDVIGVYNGASGALGDVPGVQILGSAQPTDALTPPPGRTYLDQRPIPLVTGATYAGRASISWPLSMFVARGDVASALTDRGFREIAVYMAPEELPAEWPATERGGDVFARATYAGPPMTFDVPSQVQSLWREG